MTDDAVKRMQLQWAEFDAANEFSAQLKRLNQTAVVDDDYPEVRYNYEGVLAGLIEAMNANGRFGKGNRYGLHSVHATEQPRAVPEGCIPIHRTLLDKLATDMDAIDMPKIATAIRRWVASYDAQLAAAPSQEPQS